MDMNVPKLHESAPHTGRANGAEETPTEPETTPWTEGRVLQASYQLIILINTSYMFNSGVL